LPVTGSSVAVRSAASFLVVGGFALILAGYARTTGDIDILIDTHLENEARDYEALATLPDGCARELEPGEVEKYSGVRVADEILVDLMAKASALITRRQRKAWSTMKSTACRFHSRVPNSSGA